MQANEWNAPRKNMRTRCKDSAHPQPAENRKGHHAMDLQTGQDVIRGGKNTVTLLMDTAKNMVESMGIKEGFKILKFQ